MTLEREVPGIGTLQLDHLLLDLNGTVSWWGDTAPGVAQKLSRLTTHLEIHLLSADTYGTLAENAADLGIRPRTVLDGIQKRDAVEELGPLSCVAIGNGANDALMLESAQVGIAVAGPEGVSVSALKSADIVCTSIGDALDVILYDSGLAATLRP